MKIKNTVQSATAMRLETDSIGSLAVPRDAYYGIHTVRARNNFPVTSQGNDPLLIKNYLKIKLAAAIANKNAHSWEINRIPDAIIAACEELLAHFEQYQEQFFLPAIQGGAGTSTNMNVNEVVANKALELLGEPKGTYTVVNPNDDVNKSQSTNDTYPTAGHLTLLDYTQTLANQVESLIDCLTKLSTKYRHVLKLGRTQLEDAVPTNFGRSFRAYASMLKRDVRRLKQVEQSLSFVPLGGTAIGTGLTATSEYMSSVVDVLSQVTKQHVKQCPDLIDGIQNNDVYVEVANAYKTLAVNISKMCNDLRLLNSGPQAGLGEVSLPKKQAGSSIMPGKVNPVICEVCTQVAYQVVGHATTVTMAAEAGQLELNAFEPVAFFDLFSDAKMLTQALVTLEVNCLKDIKVNEEHCLAMVQKSSEVATALSPYLGYEQTCHIIKKAIETNHSVRELIGDRLSQEQLDEILAPTAFFVSPS